MKKQKIISCINIFLLFTILGLIFNQNRNINKETKVIKQMSESEQVSNYEAQINQYIASHTEYANSIQTAKKNLATAITNEGVATSETDTFGIMATNIGNILQARTKDATATADNITEGKTAYVNGELIIGTGVDNDSYYQEGYNEGYDKGKEKILIGTYSDKCYEAVTFDIKSIYSEYSLLTSDNFFTKIKSIRCHGYSGNWVTNEQKISYNNSTGLLTCTFGVNGNPYTWAHVTADIYLIP